MECPECGQQISDQAASCPSCGFPLDKVSPAPRQAGLPNQSDTSEVRLGSTANPADVVVGVALIVMHLLYVVSVVTSLEALDSGDPKTSGLKFALIFALFSLFICYMGFEIARSRFNGFDGMKSCIVWGVGIVYIAAGPFVGNYVVAVAGLVTIGGIIYSTLRLSGRLLGAIHNMPEESSGDDDAEEGVENTEESSGLPPNHTSE